MTDIDMLLMVEKGIRDGICHTTGDQLGKIIWNLPNSQMVLLILLMMYFKFSPKLDLSSKNITRCFWYGVWANLVIVED